VKEYERKQLLERVDREAATVGADVPEDITLDGESFPLREFVFEVRTAERVPAERREELEWATKQLRRARLERRQTIEEGAVSFAEGEALAAEVVGIDRALNALSDLAEPDLESRAQESSRADQERWLTFLKRALGREEATNRGRRGGP